MNVLKYLIAVVFAVLLAACGGGSEEAVTPAQAAASLQSLASTPRKAATVSADAAETLMNYAETFLPSFFPGHPATQTAGAFKFRYYASTGLYLGVVVVDGTAYTFNGVYVLGGPFGLDLAHPYYAGQVSNYVNVGGGGGGNLTLDITVTMGQYGTFSYSFPNMPVPNTQSYFCEGLSNDTTFASISQLQGFSATWQITNCSFSSNTGTVSALLTVTSPISLSIPYTVTYTFH